jgi:hypothetical protein
MQAQPIDKIEEIISKIESAVQKKFSSDMQQDWMSFYLKCIQADVAETPGERASRSSNAYAAFDQAIKPRLEKYGAPREYIIALEKELRTRKDACAELEEPHARRP